jgi:hypothetical protein
MERPTPPALAASPREESAALRLGALKDGALFDDAAISWNKRPGGDGATARQAAAPRWRHPGTLRGSGFRRCLKVSDPPERRLPWTVVASQKKQTTTGTRTKATSTTWLVEYHADAVVDLKGFNAREQKGALTVIEFLRQLGTKIQKPHMKSIKGERKIRELRPSGGRLLIRPLYFQHDERTFKIVAMAPESMEDGPGFEAAIKRAKDRAKDDYGVDI